MFNKHIVHRVAKSEGLHPYFIKNPVCIRYSSLDYHLDPLWVILIGVTIKTLKPNSTGFGSYRAFIFKARPIGKHVRICYNRKPIRIRLNDENNSWITSPVLWHADNVAALL